MRCLRRCGGRAVAAATLLALGAAAGAAPAPAPIPAPSSERSPSQLVVDACGPEAAREAVVEFRGSARAQILCGSVERVANYAIRLRSECTLQEQSWQCRPLVKEFTLPINSRDVIVTFPPELNSLSAWQMVQAIGPMTVPVAAAGAGGRRDGGRRDDRERCALTGDNSDAAVARMTLRCQVWTVEFVKLCGATGCRFEPAARRGTGGAMQRRGQRESGPPKPGD